MPAPGSGRWPGAAPARSRRCPRAAGHQLADLSKGSIGADGCLVCPWHGSRYDLDTGEMTQGPKGFLVYVGRTPGYTQLIKGVAQVLRLRTRAVDTLGKRFIVRD